MNKGETAQVVLQEVHELRGTKHESLVCWSAGEPDVFMNKLFVMPFRLTSVKVSR